MGKEPDVDEDVQPALQFDTEPAVKPEDLEPLPSNETLAEDSHQVNDVATSHTRLPTPTTFLT